MSGEPIIKRFKSGKNSHFIQVYMAGWWLDIILSYYCQIYASNNNIVADVVHQYSL